MTPVAFAYDTEQDLYVDRNSKDLDYTDGSEDYLIDLFARADGTDLYAKELQRAIRDWPSRYHLSYLRTNLLESVRTLFKKEWEVLELGAVPAPSLPGSVSTAAASMLLRAVPSGHKLCARERGV